MVPFLLHPRPYLRSYSNLYVAVSVIATCSENTRNSGIFENEGCPGVLLLLEHYSTELPNTACVKSLLADVIAQAPLVCAFIHRILK